MAQPSTSPLPRGSILIDASGVHDSHGRLLQALMVTPAKKPSRERTLVRMHMGAAEFEHGAPEASFNHLAKKKWGLRVVPICAFGGWTNLFLFCPPKFDVDSYAEEVILLALGAEWLHRPAGLESAVKQQIRPVVRAGGPLPSAWLDIERHVMFCLEPEIVQFLGSILSSGADGSVSLPHISQ